MALQAILLSWWAVPLVVAVVAASYLYSYLVTYGQFCDIPAPLGAQLSNLWLFFAARRGKRYLLVDEAHKRLGKMVRIQPNHVSIADESAIAIVYGHGNGTIKSDFYDIFVSIRPGIFSTRSRTEHARKRKIVSHTFSAKSVTQMEPYMRQILQVLVRRLDGLVAQTGQGSAQVDLMRWFNFLTFDMIGDLAFGAPFGMLEAGEDTAEMRLTADSAVEYVPAIEVLNDRGDVNATLGCLPQLDARVACWLPDPFFRQGLTAVSKLAGIAIARVEARFASEKPMERVDLLGRLIAARESHGGGGEEGEESRGGESRGGGGKGRGQPLSHDEVTAEALVYVIAGSDTMANTSCALANYLLRHPRVMRKLQAELDAAMADDVDVPTWDAVRDLEYLSWTINEALRHHSTSSLGLPRQLPRQLPHDSPGVTILGHYFPPGTVLSVPSYTLHHSKEIWGPDADEFRPERWEAPTREQKACFIPFSHGPRACLGRNVAEMELRLIAATWVKRYSVALRQGDMETREGFLRKPLSLHVSISPRSTS